MRIDKDGCGATYVVDLAEEGEPSAASPRRRLPDTQRSASTSVATEVVLEVQRTRHAARARVVERVGRALGARTDVHGIAETVLDLVADTLGIEAIALDLCLGASDELSPVRVRGLGRGAPVNRTLEHAGRRIGELRTWPQVEASGETLAALDIVVPWIAVAFGTALALTHERRARQAAEAALVGAERILEELLAKHPSPVYVVTDDAKTHPANDAAKAALAADPHGILQRLAHALGDPTRADIDVLPVRIADRVDRVVLIERGGGLSLEAKLRAAGERWRLSPRQCLVLDRVARGMSNKEIASELDCAEVTIENHLTAIFRKASVDGRGRLLAAVHGG
ncbi:MAG: hypothetical protein IT378_07290 [Sandaracinaceae bacterium]|nr:hypothetical protein [Sandaracinaceae bacterium]